MLVILPTYGSPVVNRTYIVVALVFVAALGALGLSFRRPTALGPDYTVDIAVDGAARVAAPETDRYANALSAVVDDTGLVNYAELKANPADLNAYLTSVANLDPAVFKTWPKDDRIAFWCNVYNAYTLKAIIDHYPIQSSFLRSLKHPKNSIRQIAGVWDTLQWPIMGAQRTLDNIEHDTLRTKFDEPRIHAALVCAARSCPPLRNEPYTGDRLDEQLNDQMAAYLGDPKRFRIDHDNYTVYLSSILKWYGEDFVESYGVDEGFGGRGPVERAVLNAIAPHIPADASNFLRTAEYDVAYLDYDWSLNEQ